MTSEHTARPARPDAGRPRLGRRTFLGYAGAGAGVVAAVQAAGLPSAHAAAARPAVPSAARAEPFAGFAANPPFSFSYGGQPSSVLLRRWHRSTRTIRSAAGRVSKAITWTDPATGLRVRAVVVSYPQHRATEWTVYFTNTSAATSPALSSVLAADTVLHRSTAATYVLHHFNGSADAADDYAPQDTALAPGSPRLLFPQGGRPSNGTWPYFNLDWGGRGAMVAIGWPGQWTSQLEHDPSRGLVLRAGMTSADPATQPYTDISGAQLLDTTLEPGEEVRTPLVVVMRWTADTWADAQNAWRRWMIACNLPRFGGSLPGPIAPTGTVDGYYPNLLDDQADELLFLGSYVRHGTTPDRGGPYTHWWMDAGWYPIPASAAQDSWSYGAGNWFPDPARFPHGLRPVFERAHQHQLDSLLWSEPERAMPGTWLATHHPDWLIATPGVAAADQVYLLDFGNAAAQKWAVEHFDWLITSQGVAGEGLNVFRQDFNMDPLDYWNSADLPGRSGMTQVGHVVGHLRFWDELRRRHPKMWIDSCASGGRRNDLETMRRAVPLLRSDYQFEPIGNQSQTYGISFWLPYYGTGVGPGDVGDGSWGDPVYVMRSSLAPCYASSLDVRTAPASQWDELRQVNDDFEKIKNDILYSDYYPLTAFSLDDDVWLAFQFHRPQAGRGNVQAFRRPQASATQQTLRLRGLKPGATYEVENLDGGRERRTGASLLRDGLTVTLTAAPGAAIFSYREV